MKVMNVLFAAVTLFALLAGNAGAANVYLSSVGNGPDDTALVNALQSRGHTVTVGVHYEQLNGTQDLSAYNAVIVLPNSSWNSMMPDAGQQALVNYVAGGGGLVTGEWTLWRQMTILNAALPATTNGAYNYNQSTTYSRPDRPLDPVMDAGIPTSFSFSMSDYGGTQSLLATNPGATLFYETTYNSSTIGTGLAGWGYGSGRAASFSTLLSATELGYADYAQLFSNSIYWVAGQSTVVPVPAAVWLLGSGLAGLFGIKRRFRQ